MGHSPAEVRGAAVATSLMTMGLGPDFQAEVSL